MIIFPAIDLRQGRCVRLYQGDPAQQTVYSDDPVATAHRWADEGSAWLHVVNLDGAFGEEGPNLGAIHSIIAAMTERGVAVQVGGGLRTVADVERVIEWGAARAILGTVAVREPEIVQNAVAWFGAERVIVGIDARQGIVAISGWQDTSAVTVLDLVLRMKELGATRIIYTDIGRDGTHQGPNIALTGELAQKSGLAVIASGGVGTLEHLRQVRWLEPYGVEGVIVGKALYDGVFTLRKAMQSTKESGT